MPNANDFINRIDSAKTPEAVDAIFADIAALPDVQRKAVIVAVEDYAVTDWDKAKPPAAEMAQMRTIVELLDQIKDTPQGKMMKAALEAEGEVDAVEGQALSQIIFNVHKLRGEDASPFVKTFVAEAAKLSDEEYGTTLGLIKLMVNVADKMDAQTKPAVRANPFRKPAAGGFQP